MVQSEASGDDDEEGASPVPPAPLWKRVTKGALKQVHLIASAVVVAVATPLILQLVGIPSSSADRITIDAPKQGSHADAAPCLRVEGHGIAGAGARQVIAVQRIDGPDTVIRFFADIRIVGDEWHVSVPLDGPQYSWFRIRSVVLPTELTEYLESVGGAIGGSSWISPTMPPGSAISDPVDVQRGPGKSC
ncbi:hypothetical protein [Sphaerisporangium fuscum]|uniref:hypothetical protein n=1 Tax=Sphaerisporangium fuscum TaxID=2835868 RepID=UPI001BDC58EC|nr:hypothetical protein [Sphaerisporangium fuscum]